MDATELTKDYIADARVMQLATLHEGKPWICTVYYIYDADYNLYWTSLPTRKHSQDIAADPHVAVAIAVKLDQPIIGLQAAGTVTVVQDAAVVKSVMGDYAAKYHQGQDFYDNFVAATNQHTLYKFIPDAYVLFDEVNFPGGVGTEVKL